MRLSRVVGLDLHFRGRPGGSVTVIFALAPRGYMRRWKSFRPTLRVATPARSPVGEWQELHFPVPLKYCLP